MFPPNSNNVACIGFTRGYLRQLIKAVESRQVAWDPSAHSMYCEAAVGRFTYRGCVFELSESTEMVESIKLISGDIVEGLANGNA